MVVLGQGFALGAVFGGLGAQLRLQGLRQALAVLVGALEGRRSVASVDLRISDATGELQLVLACKGGRLPGGKAWARELIRTVPGLVSVAVSEADPHGKRVMGRRPRMVAGEAELTERIGATSYALYPGAFFQADPQNAVQIHDLVREGVGNARRVADLYAGVGAYARMLAPSVDRVFAVEEVPQAARAARAGGPDNLEVVASRVEDVVLQERFDAVVVNPARHGCEPEALVAIARCTDRMVMVSCGPESFARDLDVLAAHGLRVAALHAGTQGYAYGPVELHASALGPAGAVRQFLRPTDEGQRCLHASRVRPPALFRGRRSWVSHPLFELRLHQGAGI